MERFWASRQPAVSSGSTTVQSVVFLFVFVLYSFWSCDKTFAPTLHGSIRFWSVCTGRSDFYQTNEMFTSTQMWILLKFHDTGCSHICILLSSHLWLLHPQCPLVCCSCWAPQQCDWQQSRYEGPARGDPSDACKKGQQASRGVGVGEFLLHTGFATIAKKCILKPPGEKG